MERKLPRFLYKLMPDCLKEKYYYIRSLYRISAFSSRNKSYIQNINNVIIFLPTIDWNELVQRPQQLAKAFARLGWNVIYLTNNYSSDQVKGIEKLEENLFLCSTIRLMKVFKGAWVYNPWPINIFFLKYFRNYKLIYDYLDKLDVHQFHSTRMIKNHLSMVKNAAVILASSLSLQEDILKERKDVLLCPNAASPGDFEVNSNNKVPEDLKEVISKGVPIIGYYGAFFKWIDFELILHSASQLLGFTFVLIGFDCDDSRSKYNWKAANNIVFLGKKKYKELPSYARFFDAAIIPFKVNDITNAVSPVKLFEYMALKLPIVSTSISECMKYESVLISQSKDEFIINLKRAINLKEDLVYQRILGKDLSFNTWDYRCQCILDRISKFDKKEASHLGPTLNTNENNLCKQK